MTRRFWRAEVRPLRVVVLLVALPLLLVISSMVFVSLLRSMGFDLEPPYLKLRVGMSPSTVREIMGEPDNIAVSEDRGKSREDWWYTRGHGMQLIFVDGELKHNNSKDGLRR